MVLAVVQHISPPDRLDVGKEQERTDPIIRIVIAANDMDIPGKPANILDVLILQQIQVTKMIDRIVWPDNSVPVADDLFIHFLNSLKSPLHENEIPVMSEMGIGRKENSCLQVYNL